MRCKFRKYRAAWQRRNLAFNDVSLSMAELEMRIPTCLARSSWLASRAPSQDPSAQWGVGCWLCAHAGKKNAMAEFKVGQANYGSLHQGNLGRHAKSDDHVAAVREFLEEHGVAINSTGVDIHAPTVAEFQWVLHQIHKHGGHLGAKVGPDCRKKFLKMAWCLAEVAWRRDRDLIQKETGPILSLFRDERKGHLLLRMSCVGHGLELKHFLVGIVTRFGTGAVKVTQATELALRRFASDAWARPPAPGQSCDETHDNTPSVDESLFQKMREGVRFVAVDSASDELASARLMCMGGEALCPNIELTLRDKAHASRRCLARPWQADTYINDLLLFFVRHKNCLVQKLSHSPDLREMFTRNVTMMKGRLQRKSGCMVALHAAKHRFESYAGPLAMLVVNLPAFIFTAREIVIRRQGPEVACAQAFLEHVNTERCLLLALLADASDDGLEFTRCQDSFDSAHAEDIQDNVHAFAVRIVELYKSGGAFRINGYTSYMLNLLQNTPVTYPVAGALRTLGGKPVSEDTQAQCLRHMAPWVELCMDVLRAEYPAFEAVQAFRVFANLAGLAPSQLPDFQDKTEPALRDVEVLGKMAGVTVHGLIAEMQSVHHVVHNELTTKPRGAIVQDVWVSALKRCEAAYRITYCSLRAVLCRLLSARPCTSSIEQNFSLLDRYLHKRREALSDKTINILAKVLLDIRPADGECVATMARQIWARHFGRPRVRRQVRIDKGRPNEHARNPGTATALQRSRRHDAAQLVQSRRRHHAHFLANEMMSGEPQDEHVPGWSDAHEAERNFLRQKRRRLECETGLAGFLPACALNNALLAEVADLDRNNKKSCTRMLADDKRRDLQTHGGQPQSLLQFQGCEYHVHSSLRTTAVMAAAQDLRLGIQVPEPTVKTQLFVLPDASAPDDRAAWHAQLNGGTLLLPSVLSGGAGPVLTYQNVFRVRRKIFVSPRFRTTEAWRWEALSAMLAGTTWDVLSDARQFQAEKNAAHRKRVNATVIGLFLASELAACQKLPAWMNQHMFTSETLLRFLRKIDLSRSNLGPTQM